MIAAAVHKGLQQRRRPPTSASAAGGLRYLWSRPALAAALAVLALIVAGCLFGPLLTSTSAQDIVAGPLLPPSLQHPFGTDSVGRDVFIRTMEGGRNDLMMVSIIVVSASLIGSALGIFFASGPRWADTLFMRVTDAVIAFPALVLIIAIAVVFSDLGAVGPLPRGAAPAVIAVVFIGWPAYARLVRGEALSLAQRDFVKAATVLGYSRVRIATRHILPNVAPSILSYVVIDCIVVVAAIAGMPLLGAGIQPPEPEWGSIMLSGSLLLQSAWWITLGPGLVLVLFGVSLSAIADALSSQSGTSR